MSYEQRKRHFLQLLMPVYPRLQAYAFAMAGNRDDGQDLVGETVLSAFEHFDSLRDESAFAGYVFRIAGRLIRRKRWRARLFDPFDTERAESIPFAGTPPDISVDVELLYGALRELPEQQREAIILFELSGFSLNEIQELQGGSLSSIKMRLVRGRKRLAEILRVSEEYDDPSPPRSASTPSPTAADYAPSNRNISIHA